MTEKAGLANARLARAIDLDEAGKKGKAKNEYMRAAELYLEGISIFEDLSGQEGGTDDRGGGVGGRGGDLSSALKRRLEGAMGESEQQRC